MDMTKVEIGMQGETIIRELLKGEKHKIAQLDIVSICPKGKVYLYEVKHQERFEAPPFDGHGLPPWQAEFRLRIAKKTGMIPVFVVVEIPTGRIFYQLLTTLDAGEKFVTKTGKRVIYPLTSFKEFQNSQL